MKRVVKKALKRAKEIEKHKIQSQKDITKHYEESLRDASKLKSLLKPLWFLGKIKKKTAKKAPGSTRKKKGL